MSRRRHRRSAAVGTRLAAALALAVCVTPPLHGAEAVETEWRWRDAGRVVAFGDVHGAHAQLVSLLRKVGVIDREDRWSAGATHLVSLGDLLDRGPDERAVLDLLMRLEAEAAAAGGRVHVLLGNHELMNLTGDFRYVHSAAYAAFADEEDEAERAAALEAFRGAASSASGDDAVVAAAFAARYPAGFFARRRAFSADGVYGRWLLRRPAVIAIDETAFVHGGLPRLVAELGAERLNRDLAETLRSYLELRGALVARDVLPHDFSSHDRLDDVAAFRRLAGASEVSSGGGEPVAGAAETQFDPLLVERVQRFRALDRSVLLNVDGPLWYRRDAWCHPLLEQPVLESALERLGASRVVVGHTPTPDRLVRARLDGRVVLLDTGMVGAPADGRASALIVEGGELSVVYADRPGNHRPLAEGRRIGARAVDVDDDALERLLETAEVLESEAVGAGTTRPERVTLAVDGGTIHAVFETEHTATRGERAVADRSERYEHEVAAYRLDRLLGLELVPVTVRRSIGGVAGSLQLSVEEAISELERRRQGVEPEPWCPVDEQLQLLWLFDVLLYNEDRTLEDILYWRPAWRVVAIDHSRAFRTRSGRPPNLRSFEIRIPPAVAERLASLDHDALRSALGDLLSRQQIRAILERRDELLRAQKRPAA